MSLDEQFYAFRAEANRRLDAIETDIAGLADIVARHGPELDGVIRLRDDLEATVSGLARRLNGVESDIRSFGLGVEPAELAAYEPGPARAAMTIAETPGDLVASVDKLNDIAEASGWVVESMQFQTNYHDAHAAFITYRLPAPAREASDDQ